MFEVVGQDIISGMGFIGTDSDRLYRMGAAEKTEDVTVTGNPAVLDNATGKPFRDLHIYGRSEQVTTTGAQLLISTKEQESNVGVTLTKKENGLWHLEGTNTEAIGRNIRLVEPTEHFKLPEGTYTISVGAVGIYQQLDVTTARVKNPDDGSSQEWTVIANAGINSSKKFVCDGTEEALSLFVIFNGNATLDCDLYVMLNSGDAALPWEPYTGGKPSPSPDYPQEIVNAGKDGNLNVMVRTEDNSRAQSLALSTPNGLPGIPVTSGGNYTDENGQQWICDEVDFGRGVYVQRVAEAKIKPETVKVPTDPKWYDSEKSYSYEAEYAEFAIDNTDNGKGFCSHLSSYTFMELYNKGIETGWLGVFYYGVFNFSKSLGICKTVDEFLTWIQDVKIYKILEHPIETPLTASEIVAYKALHTYRGTTIVEAEDEAGISVTYRRSAKTDNTSAERKIEESEKKEYDES